MYFVNRNKRMSGSEIIGRALIGASVAGLLFILILWCVPQQSMDINTGSHGNCTGIPSGQVCPLIKEDG